MKTLVGVKGYSTGKILTNNNIRKKTMALDCKPNKGVMFYDRDKSNEKAPDLTGEVQVTKELMKNLDHSGGDNLRIVAWENVSQAGNKYLSLKVEVPNQKNEPTKAHEPKPKDDDDDLPF